MAGLNVSEIIYERLTTFAPFTALGCPLSPVLPTSEIPELPWASYAITAQESIAPTLDDDPGLIRSALSVVVDAATYAEVEALASAVRAGLHLFSGGQITGIHHTMTDLGQEEGESGFVARLDFEVVSLDAAVLPVESGLPLVEVREDGLYFDGVKLGGGLPPQTGQAGEYLKTNGTTASWEPVPAAPDLSGYARKNAPNVFTVSQYVGAGTVATILDPGSITVFDDEQGVNLTVGIGGITYSDDNGTVSVGPDGFSGITLANLPAGIAKTASANTFTATNTFNGTVAINRATTIQPNQSNIVPLTVKGATGQSSDLIRCQTSTNTDVFAVSAPTGGEPVVWLKGNGLNALGFRSNGYSQLASGTTLSTHNFFAVLGDSDGVSGGIWRNLSSQYLIFNGSNLTTDIAAPRTTRIYGGDPGFPALTVHGKPGQTADLQQWQDSSGTVYASVSAAGRLGLYGPPDPDYSLSVGGGSAIKSQGENLFAPYSPGLVPLTVKGAAGQTAPLTSWQDSTGAVKASVGADGTIDAPNLILKSPNGTKYNVHVADDGTLSTSPA